MIVEFAFIYQAIKFIESAAVLTVSCCDYELFNQLSLCVTTDRV